MLIPCRSLVGSIFCRTISSRATQPTLYETLKVIETSPDVFTQPADTLFVFPNRSSVFGGQIIGSAMYAAQKTLTKNYPLHSLHSYFLSGADNSSPISYTIQRLRDGRSFEVRSVTARQDNRVVFQCDMSFHQQEQSNLEYQPSSPVNNIQQPEELLSFFQRIQNLLNDPRVKPELRPLIEAALEMPLPLDIRYCDPRDLLQPEPRWPARKLAWMKSLDPLPNDPHLHRAAIAYASDWVLLSTALQPFNINKYSLRVKMQASLGHTMWFHDSFEFQPPIKDPSLTKDESFKPVRRSPLMPPPPEKLPIHADDWLLYELICPVATNNRALAFGRIWTRNGRLIVSCAQEGVIRYE
ncbi:unnamed protein product [Rotaria sp. Silwood2]|nr:unnamed protein product [Rotaria sp. Silwood2]CAF2968896.1 unnamed protein product [Rotaria sp. Silwood2]CAF4158852.1 unnamed protein product [Rotaria sp. Silwood2]CAF4233158.1 unnamed protein product [Rotaria sp. Silwood2]